MGPSSRTSAVLQDRAPGQQSARLAPSPRSALLPAPALGAQHHGARGAGEGQRTSSWLEQGRICTPKQSALLAPSVGARLNTRPRQLSPPAVGTHQCRVGARFQRRQHWFIGYFRSAGTSNGAFISLFSCQYRPSQSDSVDIKNAYFSAIHYLQAKTTSGSPACHTKRDRLKLEKATQQLPEL